MHHEVHGIDIIFYVQCSYTQTMDIEHIYNGKKGFSFEMVYIVTIIHHCRMQSRLSLVPACKNGEHWRDETRLWRQHNKYGSFNKLREFKDFDKQSQHINRIHSAMYKFIFLVFFIQFVQRCLNEHTRPGIMEKLKSYHLSNKYQFKIHSYSWS